jgi:hypothetical protein
MGPLVGESGLATNQPEPDFAPPFEFEIEEP